MHARAAGDWVRKHLLEALERCSHRGCSPKQILGRLKLCSKLQPRNLGMQLRAALKRAVGEGLLKLRAGRYSLKHLKKVEPSKKAETRPKNKHGKSVQQQQPSSKSKSKTRRKRPRPSGKSINQR